MYGEYFCALWKFCYVAAFLRYFRISYGLKLCAWNYDGSNLKLVHINYLRYSEKLLIKLVEKCMKTLFTSLQNFSVSKIFLKYEMMDLFGDNKYKIFFIV